LASSISCKVTVNTRSSISAEILSQKTCPGLDAKAVPTKAIEAGDELARENLLHLEAEN